MTKMMVEAPMIGGAASRTCSHDRESNPPVSQKRISRSASLLGTNTMMAETMAPKNALTATPASNSVAMLNRPPTDAIPYTRNAATIAPRKAKADKAW